MKFETKFYTLRCGVCKMKKKKKTKYFSKIQTKDMFYVVV